MKISRTKLASVIFLIALIVLTLVAFLNGQDISSIILAMESANVEDLSFAVLCVIAFLFMQGVIFRCVFAMLGQKTTLAKCAGYSFKGYFFCNVTPFALGGPPAQILYMKKDDVSIPTASVAVVLVALLYKFVLVILGFGLIIFGQGFLRAYVLQSIIWFGVGLFLTCGFCFLLFMFMFHPVLVKKAAFNLLRKLEKRHIIKHVYGREESIEIGLSRYTETAEFIKKKPASLIVILLLTVIQRFFLFAVTYFVYISLGYHSKSIFTIVLLQATISLCVDLLPIPGGMGISESLFTVMFQNLFASAAIIPALALSRGISYYVQLIICAAVIFISQYAFRGRRQRINAEQA